MQDAVFTPILRVSSGGKIWLLATTQKNAKTAQASAAAISPPSRDDGMRLDGQHDRQGIQG